MLDAELSRITDILIGELRLFGIYFGAALQAIGVDCAALSC